MQKVLAKGKPAQQAEYVQRFQRWFEPVCQGKLRLIYIDEAHLHQDLALGYRWSAVGEADWCPVIVRPWPIGSTGMEPMTLVAVNVCSGINTSVIVKPPSPFCTIWLSNGP
ncbi:MAG: hypothetical protein H6633_34525 [Anaerolineales bacterium]|nr:hypothetical protein [Anaerolineales bacterium]